MSIVKGHLASNGGIQGHSAGEFFPFRVYAQGAFQHLAWRIALPNGKDFNMVFNIAQDAWDKVAELHVAWSSVFEEVPGPVFRAALEHAQRLVTIKENCTRPPLNARHYLASKDGYYYGYAVSSSGELCAVFSELKGNGKAIMQDVVKRNQATHLNCFYGYLAKFYAKYGFTVTAVQDNWEPGGPSVVIMKRKLV